MGVHGLWRLIEPSGKPVPLETLENKVLAVDVSIWLHQSIKGFQDSRGQPLPNAHLLGIYHRVCKLLYYKIRPIFVFDGGVPVLKKQTIAKRNQQTTKNVRDAGEIQKQLINTLLKHSAINKVLRDKAKASLEATANIPTTSKRKSDDLYALPPTEIDTTISSSDEESEVTSTSDSSPTKHWDLHTIDVDSKHFKSLPANVRHEILTELKETRKQSSWGRLHELPTQSDDFASFQMNRLRRRWKVQVNLEQAEQEMGGCSLSLVELESLLKDHGVITTNEIGSRIASNEETRYLLIKDVKKAIEKAKQEQTESETTVKEINDDKVVVALETIAEEAVENEDEILGAIAEETSSEPSRDESAGKGSKTKVELEYESDMERAIQLSLECVETTPEASTSTKEKKKDVNFVENFNDADFMSNSSGDESISENVLVSAKNYMMEYSGLTPAEIAKIMNKTKPGLKIATKEKKEETIVNGIEQVVEEVEKQLAVDQEAKGESIDVMSESSSSSEDFVEVNSALETAKVPDTIQGLHILINPEEAEEDDLFKDIFEEETKKLGIEKTASSPRKVIETTKQPVTVEPKIKEPLEVKEKETKTLISDILESVPGPKLDSGGVPAKPLITVEQLKQIKENLSKEKEELISARNSKEKLAGTLTDQMYQEAQELLSLFGVPYVVAPMEAEAQCAYLDAINLTDGTITDDSDIWLFGGKTVYKNFFNQNKHVMEFRAENIQHHFSMVNSYYSFKIPLITYTLPELAREQMVLLALLVGSDYTTGLQGIGPVTALEVLAAFPPSSTTEFHISHDQLLSGLSEFQKWINSDQSIPGKMTLKSKLKNVKISDNFPSLQVLEAYLEPKIDQSEEAFSWAKPDLVGLSDFAREKFGWTRTKSEEILKPVLKRLSEKISQTSIKDYFKTKHKIDSGEIEQLMSKRVKKAVDRIGKGQLSDEETKANPKPAKGRKRKEKTENPKIETTSSKLAMGKKKIDLSKPETSRKSSKPREQQQNKSKSKENKEKEAEAACSDEEMKLLVQTEEESKKKVEAIEAELKKKMEVEENKRKRVIRNIHMKEVILQKEQDKTNLLKKKMRAIEVYRKSKQGPGYCKKRAKVVRAPKEDAELSTDSSTD